MHIAAEIELLSEQLDIGDNIRAICPLCEGGSSNEKSLSITLSAEGLVWQCFRAKCGLKGATGTRVAHKKSTKLEPKKPARKKFAGTTVPLSDEHLKRIHELWGITNPEHWYWTDAHGGRVAMSIRSPKYTHRGWLLRDIYNKHNVKALTYIDEGEEGLAWYKTNPSAPTVLVEDIPSAVRASRYTNAVALLGTGIGLARAKEIADYATRPVVVALDQDATELSFKWANKWALFWGDVKVLPLQKDMKDMSEEDLCTLLKTI